MRKLNLKNSKKIIEEYAKNVSTFDLYESHIINTSKKLKISLIDVQSFGGYGFVCNTDINNFYMGFEHSIKYEIFGNRIEFYYPSHLNPKPKYTHAIIWFNSEYIESLRQKKLEMI